MDTLTAGPIIGALGAGLGAVAVVFALLYAPGPPRCTLTRDSLTIHDRFYPFTVRADAVDLGGVQVVDRSASPEWRPVRRTNGFSNGNYQAGSYRVAGGQTIRLYRAKGQRLVLLPPKGNGVPVLLEAPEPDRFVAELQHEWAGR